MGFEYLFNLLKKQFKDKITCNFKNKQTFSNRNKANIYSFFNISISFDSLICIIQHYNPKWIKKNYQKFLQDFKIGLF